MNGFVIKASEGCVVSELQTVTSKISSVVTLALAAAENEAPRTE